MPLKLAATDNHGQLHATKRENTLLLVITDRFFMMVKTVPLTNKLADSIAKASVDSLVVVYGPPTWLLYDNRSPCTSMFLEHVCRILGLANFFSMTYHLQCDRHME